MKTYGTPLAIIVAAVIIVAGAHLVGESIWNALTAIGTISAVVLALYLQLFRTWKRRPVLEIGYFEPKPPHLRCTPGTNIKTGEVVGTLYPLSIRLLNKGRTLAKNAQPLITAMGSIEDGKWTIHPNWIPAPLRWGLDEYTILATGKPTEEKDLIPHRPYFFNLGLLGTDAPKFFRLNPITMPGGQLTHYGPGEFCFELSAFAEKAEPTKKYFHIQWDGGCTENFEEVKKKIRIFSRDNPPWK